MNKSVHSGNYLNESTELHESYYLSTIDSSYLRTICDRINYLESLSCILTINSADEYISVVVEDGQIVLLDWCNHFERGACVNENVPLLPFADIERAIKNAVFTEHFLDEGINDTVRIVRIELNMMRVRQRDAADTCYFLPVWDVLAYGTVWGDAEPVHFFSAYVTINAIDGSRIDRTRGY